MPTDDSERGENKLAGSAPAGAPAKLSSWRIIGGSIAATSWAYAVLIAGMAIMLRSLGDRWWLATVIMYGPRWPWGLPLIVLVPLALWLRRRHLVLLGATACLFVGPIMGLCVPWPRSSAPASEGRLRILTLNLQGQQIDRGVLAAYLRAAEPDVLMFQEYSLRGNPPSDVLIEVDLKRAGWYVKTTENLLVASQYPILGYSPLHAKDVCREVTPPRKGSPLSVVCKIETPWRVIQVFNFHGSSPRSGLEALLRDGRSGLPTMASITALRCAEAKGISGLARRSSEPTIVAGDFNLVAESVIFRNFWSTFRDAFSEAGFGFGATKFEPLFGARIDHILVDANWTVHRCWVGPDLGSDHRPLLADVSLQ
jgi:endonuclease/exonuclease/phosphatase (EEP) superfamily protein YafD